MNYGRLYAKIELDNIGRNVSGVRDTIPDETMIMAVIKADAYGHGAVQIASYLEDKVDWYGVATIDEAIELRQNGTKKPILILGATMPQDYSDVVKYDITVAIFDKERAECLNREAEKQGKIARVHIKVDTGMSRIGFPVNEASVLLVSDIAKLPNICVEGVFSHLAKADEADKTSALEQKALFDKFVGWIEERNIDIPIKHLSNSAGVMELDATYNMVRMGIMLYGYYPSDEMNAEYKLYPAMELISQISYIKKIKKGTGVSYGHTFVADRDMVVATVPAGYADGYPRCLSGKGQVIVNGKRCSIIGRICMDQMMIDVSDVDNVSIGDSVILVGESGSERITVEEVADNAYSFNYEFICGISRRVPRVYFDNGNFVEKISYLKK